MAKLKITVYKIELCVIDHDELGAEEIKKVLEETKYPNYCIYPKVINTEGKEIGEWSDEHPLNNRNTRRQEIDRLFSKWQPLETAPRDGTRIIFFYGVCQAVFIAYYEDDAWWIVSVLDEDVYFDTENIINCYWQPLPTPPQL